MSRTPAVLVTAAFAGVHDTAGREAAAPERLSAALGAEGDVRSARSGPLTLAWRGGGAPAGEATEVGGLLCGTMYEPGDPASVSEAWHRHGDDGLARLRGAFALVIWDAARNRGVLARDHLGERPLYWHFADGVLRFASELHWLLRMLPRRPAPDAVSVAHWLAVSGQPGGRTLYEGVHGLSAGHALALAGDGILPRPRRYWAPSYADPLEADRSELAALLRGGLERSVRRRSTDGQSTALMLSGGVDSSSVAGIAASCLGPESAPRRSYSAVFPDHPGVDESALINTLVSALDLQSTRVEVRGGSVLGGALKYLDAWQVPPISPNLFFWLPLLRQAAADGVGVLLDGEGGDEAFAASPYLLADRLRAGRVLSALRLVRELPGGPRPRSARLRLLRRYGLKAATPAAAHTLARRLRSPERHVPDWFLPASVEAWHAGDEPAAWKRVQGPRWWAWMVEATAYGMGTVLGSEHVRRRAALAGIEPRHPLVDVDVLELVLRFPPEAAFDRRWSRPLLREAVAGLVPDELRLRTRKSTFDSLFHDCLAGHDLPIARRLLGAPDARIRDYVDIAPFRRTLLEPPPPPRGQQRQRWAVWLWRALTAETWLRAQEDAGSCERLLGSGELALPDVRLRVV